MDFTRFIPFRRKEETKLPEKSPEKARNQQINERITAIISQLRAKRKLGEYFATEDHPTLLPSAVSKPIEDAIDAGYHRHSTTIPRGLVPEEAIQEAIKFGEWARDELQVEDFVELEILQMHVRNAVVGLYSRSQRSGFVVGSRNKTHATQVRAELAAKQKFAALNIESPTVEENPPQEKLELLEELSGTREDIQ